MSDGAMPVSVLETGFESADIGCCSIGKSLEVGCGRKEQDRKLHRWGRSC